MNLIMYEMFCKLKQTLLRIHEWPHNFALYAASPQFWGRYIYCISQQKPPVKMIDSKKETQKNICMYLSNTCKFWSDSAQAIERRN